MAGTFDKTNKRMRGKETGMNELNKYPFLRVKGIRVDTGEWVYGNCLEIEGEIRIATSCLTGDDSNLFIVCAYEIIPETLEFFTGKIDSNELEIYTDRVPM